MRDSQHDTTACYIVYIAMCIIVIYLVENIARVSSAAVNTRLVCCYLTVLVLLFLPVTLLRTVQYCIPR